MDKREKEMGLEKFGEFQLRSWIAPDRPLLDSEKRLFGAENRCAGA